MVGGVAMVFSFGDNPYIAIIGDIKKSRQIIDRKNVQKKLYEILVEINKKYLNDISAKFMITLGDEFQGLLHTGEHLLEIIDEIQRSMYPFGIRFGIGVGTITTDINFEMAIGADGPAFYKARQAIELLKQKEQKNKTQISDIRMEFDTDDQSTVAMLNTILTLLTVLKNNWTERQREIIWDMLVHDDGQEKSAKRLGIAQSSVHRGLMNGNYYAYREAVDTIRNVLIEIRRKHV